MPRTDARIQTMIGGERSLSAEVSHQLRTPLSGLRLELEAVRDFSRPDLRSAPRLRRSTGEWRGLHTVGVRDSLNAINGIGHTAVATDPQFRAALAAHG